MPGKAAHELVVDCSVLPISQKNKKRKFYGKELAWL
jgi:hypothetical protein